MSPASIQDANAKHPAERPAPKPTTGLAMSIQTLSFSGLGMPAKYDPRPVQKRDDCNHRLDGSSPLVTGDTIVYTCLNCKAYQTFREWKEPAKWPEKAR